MDVDSSVERVNDGWSKVAEVSLNAGQPLSVGIKDDDAALENVGEVMSDVDKTSENAGVTIASFSPSADCDVNSNVEQCTKTKGTLKQQLHSKRQQIISSNVTASSDAKCVRNPRKKSVSPKHTASQVTYYVVFCREFCVELWRRPSPVVFFPEPSLCVV